jgi:leucyl aminopeptidase
MPLRITCRAAEPLDLRADVTALGVFVFTRELPAPLKPLDALLGGGLTKLLAKEEFTGKKDQSLSIPMLGRGPSERLVLIGLGEKTAVGDGDVRALAAKAARLTNVDRSAHLVLGIPIELQEHLRAAAEGLELGAYRFTKYLTGDRRPKTELDEVTVAIAHKPGAKTKRAIELGQRVALAINQARDLSNEPGNALPPEGLAAAAQAVAKEHDLKIHVFDHKEILRRGMKLIDAVGRGSVHEPRFVHIEYVPKKAKKRLVFVGKGITFDSGGVSIKPAAGMGEMKHDMSGAANVIGLMDAVAVLQPEVEVHGIVACAENMPDGNAYRPGDVWGSLDGKTVEIINTDAEGRLLLADALAYARTLAPDLLVDNATLTGACVVALGTTCSGYYASNDATAELFRRAVKASGEQMWQLPLLEDLREQLKSEVADIKQTGDRFGGSITAALFLREFIGEAKHWVHVDIAGPASTERLLGWAQSKGATGHGVLTFLALVEQAAE